jgi:hypothetical protein
VRRGFWFIAVFWIRGIDTPVPAEVVWRLLRRPVPAGW